MLEKNESDLQNPETSTIQKEISLTETFRRNYEEKNQYHESQKLDYAIRGMRMNFGMILSLPLF